MNYAVARRFGSGILDRVSEQPRLGFLQRLRESIDLKTVFVLRLALPLTAIGVDFVSYLAGMKRLNFVGYYLASIVPWTVMSVVYFTSAGALRDTSPILVFVLELSWIDPLQLMLIGLAVAAYTARRGGLSAALFGLATSSKQSMFWLFPLAGFVLRFDRKRWLVMGFAALAPVVPFLVWDRRALLYACVEFLGSLPPRRDALCFTNAIWQAFHIAFPASTGFVLALAVVATACWRFAGCPS